MYPNSPTTYKLPFDGKIKVSSRCQFVLVRQFNTNEARPFIHRRSDNFATIEKLYDAATDYIIDQARGLVTYHFNGRQHFFDAVKGKDLVYAPGPVVVSHSPHEAPRTLNFPGFPPVPAVGPDVVEIAPAETPNAEYVRSLTPTGVPTYTSKDGRVTIEARMSRSRIVGSAMVFGQWVHENDHRPHPEAWSVYIDGRFVLRTRTLKEAKQAAARRLAKINAEYVPVLNCPGSGRKSDKDSTERCWYCGDEYVLTPTGRMPNHAQKKGES